MQHTTKLFSFIAFWGKYNNIFYHFLTLTTTYWYTGSIAFTEIVKDLLTPPKAFSCRFSHKYSMSWHSDSHAEIQTVLALLAGNGKCTFDTCVEGTRCKCLLSRRKVFVCEKETALEWYTFRTQNISSHYWLPLKNSHTTHHHV